jgi:RNA polymerase-binding transcription factor DksA
VKTRRIHTGILEARLRVNPECKPSGSGWVQRGQERERGWSQRMSHEACGTERPETGDEADRAVYGLDRELGSARVDQLNRTLRQIDKALARQAERRHGRCVACSARIRMGRLRSLPFALYCRDCQAMAEEKRPVLRPHHLCHS